MLRCTTQWHTAYCIASQKSGALLKGHCKFSATAFRALQLGLPAGTLFANANGEWLRAGEEYQVFYYSGFDNEDMDVKRLSSIKKNLPGSRNKDWAAWLGRSEQ